MTKKFFSSRAIKVTPRIALLSISLCLGACTSGDAALQDRPVDVNGSEESSEQAPETSGSQGATNPDPSTYRCPVAGDELYLVIEHNVLFEHSDLALNNILFTENPIRLVVEDFPEERAMEGEVLIEGYFEDCCKHLTTGGAGDCSASGEGRMGVFVQGSCMDGVVRLGIREEWWGYIVNVCGAELPFPDETHDQGEKEFSLSEAWTSVGAVVETPFAMGEGAHTWTLFSDLTQAENMTKNLRDNYSIPNVPLVPQSGTSDSE